jgi:hypothetical protein
MSTIGEMMVSLGLYPSYGQRNATQGIRSSVCTEPGPNIDYFTATNHR